jgi:hypothetical protein
MKKYLPYFYFLLIIIFIVALGIAFIWNEKLDTNKLIDSGKLADFFTIIGAFATSITVYLLYKQVEEMVNGRNAAYQPELFFHDKTVYTKDIPNTNMPKKGVPRPPHIVGFNTDKDAPEFYSNIVIELCNIGLGTAKKVNIQWLYDEQDVKEYIEDKYDSEQDYYKETRIDFVKINDNAELYLPYAFMQLYGMKLAPKFPNTEQQPEKPKLQIRLSYQNIFGKDYQNFFDVKFTQLTQETDKIFIRFEYTTMPVSPSVIDKIKKLTTQITDKILLTLKIKNY